MAGAAGAESGRVSFKRSTIPKRQREPGEFASFTPARSRAVMAGNLAEVVRLSVATARVVPKTPDRKDQRIRDSARGERCLMRLPGCPDDPAMTIWSHARSQRGGKGMGIKALDLCGCYACTYCDAIYDGQRPPAIVTPRAAIVIAWFEAHLESLLRLRQKGLA